MNGWSGFWIFCAVWVLAEVYITSLRIRRIHQLALWKPRRCDCGDAYDHRVRLKGTQ